MIYNKNKLYLNNKKFYSVSSYTPPTPPGGSGGDFGTFGDGTRNKFLWPFAATSIWNTPIGSGATLVASGITWGNFSYGYQTRFIDENELIFMDTSAPSCQIDYSNVGWGGGNRCSAAGSSGNFPFSVRMPSSYTIPNSGENNCAAWINAAGDTVIQAQPATRCTAGGNGTALVKFSDQDIKLAGTYGSHGGSELSALGGTVRYGELTYATANAKTYLRHALKCNMAALNWYYWGGGGGNEYRSPATKADGYASSSTYAGSNSQLKPGALLTLHSSFNTSVGGGNMLTQIGSILAETVKRFGMYCVDDTTWNAMAIAIEKGPAGNVTDEFATLTGTAWKQQPNNSGEEINWYKDMRTLFTNTYVVSNNSLANIGGGGSPLYSTPTAPAFGN